MIPLRQFHSEFTSAGGCPILAAGKGGAFSGSSDAEWTAATRARQQMTARDSGEWRERAKDVSRARHAVPLRRHEPREIDASPWGSFVIQGRLRFCFGRR